MLCYIGSETLGIPAITGVVSHFVVHMLAEAQLFGVNSDFDHVLFNFLNDGDDDQSSPAATDKSDDKKSPTEEAECRQRGTADHEPAQEYSKDK